ncbi:MAG: hypothetical protein IRZ27_06985 [Acidothermus cellulolyticus]|uniref:hypothetical protein n=1 Tax=Acidothermus cellulolyticus TaxID=28049 RepID=UPI0011D0ACE9|nr:hypothetical protein [Acidothermus cellulolyticus]MBX5448252.1 hypothetical protein [Acidothermus cellulolyticus]
MALRTVAGHQIGEDTNDLQQWLRQLTGCPTVHRTIPATCDAPSHDEPATWFYVEADPVQAVARRRCLSCGATRHVLDSEERWTAPHMWQCPGCAQSIAEVATGLHLDDDHVTWIAVAARCVGCGLIAGLTDFIVPRLPFDEVLTRI